MPNQTTRAIALDYEPNPEGDNRIDVDIRERETRVAYIANMQNSGNPCEVDLVFENCVATKYIATEPDDSICPGWSSMNSDFGEIEASPWVSQFPHHISHYRHFVFGLNHCFFECIAESYRVELSPLLRD